MAHYFDPAGLVWILACVLIATMAGRLLPKLAEPDGLRNTVAALGAMGVGAARPAEIASSTTVAGLPLQGPSPAQPTRARQAKQEVDPLVPAVLRQF